MPNYKRLVGLAVLATLLGAAACAGEDGEDGDQGLPGRDGVDGIDGVDGNDGDDGVSCWDLNANQTCDLAAEDRNDDGLCDVLDCQAPPPPPTTAYVGGQVCRLCHSAIGNKFAKSGHAHALTAAAGSAPDLPFDTQTGGIPAPPLGLTWNDVGYVIGGFGWKVLLVGDDGYVVTGNAGQAAQWNFASAHLGTSAEWVEFQAGETQPFDCGGCHTTGWIPCEIGDATCDRQDDLAGMAGSFAEPGVQCEACHGPGSEHVDAPYLVDMKIDRDPEACGKCHKRGEVESIEAEGGFIEQYGQWNELFQSKKHVMRCIDCHDPHASAKFADGAVNPGKGIRVACESCHVGYDANQNSSIMQAAVDCVDCHMPRIGKSAVSDADQRSGDLRSHIFAINSDLAAGQFAAGGSESMPYVTLEFACRNCHREDPEPPSGLGLNKSDAEIETTATGYHTNN